MMLIPSTVVGTLTIDDYTRMLALNMLPGQHAPIPPKVTYGVLREIARYSGEEQMAYLIEDTVNGIHPLIETHGVEDSYLLESALIHGNYRMGTALSVDEIAERLASPLSSEALENLRI